MKQLMITIIVGILLVGLVGCSSGNVTTENPNDGIIDKDIEDNNTLLQLTLTELSMYDGIDGRKAYIAVDSVIYDVTDVSQWSGGNHNGLYAGQDLTEEINNLSPHGTSVLDSLDVVGELVE